jgi:predicted alpha-1,2-mannosidase
MAQKLGDSRTAETFRKRSAFHRNLFDFRTNLFRGRDSKGNWREPFFPLKATSPLNNPGDYTEANAWQYLWTPFQHDLKQMIQDLGGDDLFTLKLDSFFTLQAENPDKFLGQEAMIGQYAHGNEPSHHILYLYPFSKKPERGHALIHQVVREFHKNAPDGMIGNDDCGQMSAWYILSCLGFYPVNPASGEFVLGSPQLKSAKLKLPGGKEFRIEAQNFSEQAIYNKNRFLNGKGHFNPVITYSDIMQGGSLQFDMYAK